MSQTLTTYTADFAAAQSRDSLSLWQSINTAMSFGALSLRQNTYLLDWWNTKGETSSTTLSRNGIEQSAIDQRDKTLAEWDGYVESVKSGCFVARMRGLKGDGVKGKEEEAEIPIADVEPDDLPLLVQGGYFRLLITYEIRKGGIQRRYTSVAFRRLPTYTQREIDDAEREAQEIVNGFVMAEPGNSAIA